MAVFDNSPTSYYIRMTGIIVTFNNQIYNVADFYTNKKYIYWDSNNPYTLVDDNLLSDTSLNKHLVMINDKGMSQPVESKVSNFSISFDGNSLDRIKKEVTGLHENNAEWGERFTTIETDIEGIHTNVGQLEEKDGLFTEQLTQIEQKADGIKLSLEKTQREFADNKELNELRENTNKAFIDIVASLGIAKGEFTDYFHDTKIDTEIEKPKILEHIEIIKNKESKLYAEIDKVIALIEAQGLTQDLNTLTSGKKAVTEALKNLYDTTNTIISDGTIVPSEDVLATTLFGRAEFTITSLKRTVDNLIFLGTGGMMTEHVADIYYNVNGVKETFTQTVTNMKNQTSLLKAEFQSQVNDLNRALDTYKSYIEGMLADGIITEAEKQTLKLRLEELEKEKTDIIYQYEKYKEDKMISDSTRLELKKQYDSYITRHNELIKLIDNIISDGITDDTEKLKVNTAFTNYTTSINNLKTTMDKALDELNVNKYNQAITDAKNEINKELSDVRNEVSNLDNEMNTTFKDNVIDQTERANIERDMTLINKEKNDVDNQYQLYYNNKYLDGQKKIDFKNSYDTYNTNYQELKSIVDAILAKSELVTNQDKQNIKAAQDKLFNSLNVFLDTTNKVIEYINMKANDDIKNQIGGEMGDVTTIIDTIRNEMNGVFKDGILDEIELQSLNDKLLSIEKEKKEVDIIYEEIYNNSNLV